MSSKSLALTSLASVVVGAAVFSIVPHEYWHPNRHSLLNPNTVGIPTSPLYAGDEPPPPTESDLTVRAKVERNEGNRFNATLYPKKPLRDKIVAVATGKDATSVPALLLTVEGVRLPAQSGIEGRVFLNEPKADEKTSTADMHYVGSFSLGAVEQADQPQNFILNMSRVVRKLAKEGAFSHDRPLQITVVVVTPAGTDRKPAVSLDGISLTVED